MDQVRWAEGIDAVGGGDGLHCGEGLVGASSREPELRRPARAVVVARERGEAWGREERGREERGREERGGEGRKREVPWLRLRWWHACRNACQRGVVWLGSGVVWLGSGVAGAWRALVEPHQSERRRHERRQREPTPRGILADDVHGDEKEDAQSPTDDEAHVDDERSRAGRAQLLN
jgi:hypothetical protein